MGYFSKGEAGMLRPGRLAMDRHSENCSQWSGSASWALSRATRN